MGGRSVGFAGHLEERPFEAPSADGELSLYLWMPPGVEFLAQVEGDVRLRNVGSALISVHPSMHPTEGTLEVLVRRPADRFPKMYRHLYQACVRGDLVVLGPGESRYQELIPSFAARNWLIDEPGTYEVQAI